MNAKYKDNILKIMLTTVNRNVCVKGFQKVINAMDDIYAVSNVWDHITKDICNACYFFLYFLLKIATLRKTEGLKKLNLLLLAKIGKKSKRRVQLLSKRCLDTPHESNQVIDRRIYR